MLFHIKLTSCPPSRKTNTTGERITFSLFYFIENNKISVKMDFCLNEIDWKYYRLKFIQAFGKINLEFNGFSLTWRFYFNLPSFVVWLQLRVWWFYLIACQA